MDWVKSFQSAIDYMEEHICEPTDYERIAAEMNISRFYFHRIFTVLCGFTPGEYIRNRRLSLAGGELLYSDERIIDIALKYGYDTPESFTRAFTRFHGATPNAVRKGCASVRSFARLSVSVSLKGGRVMDHRIERKEAFKIIAKEERFEKITDVCGRADIPAFWTECHADGTVEYLIKQADKNGVLGGKIVGMCTEDSTVVKDFPYFIGAEYSGGEIPEGFTVKEVPAATWAVFNMEGDMPEAVQKLWHDIFANFFPSSDYRPTCCFDLEVYSSDNFSGEIWIAVEKRQ